ncbi:hypothetical protein ACFQRL_14960 [Microbacterium fluvii]|uniref:DUF998 domain-containing protein n=1 Tax=Microbacterium fluvii TaxID=415215 RepID=A0ABW2HIK2_9MICO|nr:hypothetical protein [Microbacterium fluvii]MCU4673893.1 hypothetical protein [Microbacterium fluvii]
MTSPTAPIASVPAAAPTLRVVNESLGGAGGAALIGALLGLVSAYVWPSLPISGAWSFGDLAAIAAGLVAAVAAGTGYWRSRRAPGQEWRLGLAPWKFTVNTISVVLVHVVLATLGALALFIVLGLAFVGLTMVPFWSAVLMAVTLLLAFHLTYVSVSRMTTQRMSSLLMAFILIGALTAMVTTPDPEWWTVHFSHLGTFDAISSYVFNATLIIGGLLVTTFAVYVSNDLRGLVGRGLLSREDSPKIVSTMFVIMGVLLAGVGIVPVDVNLLIHNLSATGTAIVFLVLLVWAQRLLRGMPAAFFAASWGFFGAVVVSAVLFVVGYFGLTAFEIIVFGLIFAWISVFIRFVGVTANEKGADAVAPAP